LNQTRDEIAFQECHGDHLTYKKQSIEKSTLRVRAAEDRLRISISHLKNAVVTTSVVDAAVETATTIIFERCSRKVQTILDGRDARPG
jgi:hypothetical protein